MLTFHKNYNYYLLYFIGFGGNNVVPSSAPVAEPYSSGTVRHSQFLYRQCMLIFLRKFADINLTSLLKLSELGVHCVSEFEISEVAKTIHHTFHSKNGSTFEFP